MKDKIELIISKLKSSYIERDVTKIDDLMYALFRTQENVVFIGTSAGEWYFDYESIKGLFISDWKYWGNVIIDNDNYELKSFNSYYWIALKASVEYVFEDTEERYERYYSTIKDTAGANSTAYQKACYIEWLLAHLLHSRESDIRKYLWDLDIKIILEIVDNQPMCKIMQFSLPMSVNYTDVRIDYASYNQENYEKECAEIAKYNEQCIEDVSSIKLQLIEKIQSYIYESYENLTDTVILSENIVVDHNNETFCFCGSGTLKKTLDIEKQLSEVMQKIINRDYKDNVKDSLFKIRRDIAYIMKEYAINSNAINPFRVIGIGKISYGEIYIKKIDVSFPFSMILEQKTDFSH